VASERTRERTRRSYCPDDLRVLFIGESPPTGGTFFYDASSLLYNATRDAFVAAEPRLSNRDVLQAFANMGCYLEDLSRAPIDKLPDRDKRQARKDAVPGLARRLRGLKPRVVVVVVKGIQPQVTHALDKAGLGDVQFEALPFPGQWGRTQYRAELEDLVRDWRKRRILRAARS